MLVNLFERVQFFLKRLGVHTRITPTKEMAEILVKIMVEVLCILAIATKEVQQSRTSKSYYIRTSTNRPISCLNRNIFEETGRKGGYRRCLQEAG